MTPKRYPPLPKVVSMPGGNVTIVQRPDVKHEDGTDCWGLFSDAERVITLDSRAAPPHLWRTLYHELMHACLSDAGLDEGLHPKLVEAICQAASTARMRERFG